jgi:hypothetical protein
MINLMRFGFVLVHLLAISLFYNMTEYCTLYTEMVWCARFPLLTFVVEQLRLAKLPGEIYIVSYPNTNVCIIVATSHSDDKEDENAASIS